MPIIPSVFQPIKHNDVQQRPFKAYKRYKIKSDLIPDNSNGFFIHSGVYRNFTPHIFADTGRGVGSRIFPVNSFDNTNMHVVWNTIDHRYYREYNPHSVFDYKNKFTQERFLWYSASILTLPYQDVGEKIKAGTFQVTRSLGALSNRLNDDGDGNLIDPKVDTTKFASSSRNFFYMSFNGMYRNFDDGNLDLEETGDSFYSKSIPYELNHSPRKASVPFGQVRIKPGIGLTGSRYDSSPTDEEPSGLCVDIPTGTKGSAPHIRIPNDDKFDRFERCDNWTISFWHRPIFSVGAGGSRNIGHYIMTKWGVRKEAYFDQVDKKRKFRDIETSTRSGSAMTTAADLVREKIRTPLNITYDRQYPDTEVRYQFSVCDGEHAVSVSGSGPCVEEDTNNPAWNHVCIRNESEVCKIFVNGIEGALSGSLPRMTINSADICIGAPNRQADSGLDQALSGNFTSNLLEFMPYGGGTFSTTSDPFFNGAMHQRIAEIRFYDYAVDDVGIASLANNNYMSGSCYQTDVVGNVFPKNGQVVVSSPHPQYHTGSGFFQSTWNATYRGTHMIYENNVLVRVPKDTFNVTMNPTANYRPATVGEICAPNHQNIPTGELRKPLFISGTLKPYITTIGLYDEQARMLAIGKLSTPVQKLDDVDMNFIVRWDY